MSDVTGKPPPQRSGDPTRDARGRWRKGHCPNPKGRPRKKRFKSYDPSDIRHFGNTQIEIVTNGKVEQMDRRTALLNKLFETAMKGSPMAQRLLIQKFQKSDEEIAVAMERLDQLIVHWYMDEERCRQGVPPRVQHEILKLAAVLNHYFPGQYAYLLPGGGDHS